MISGIHFPVDIILKEDKFSKQTLKYQFSLLKFTWKWFAITATTLTSTPTVRMVIAAAVIIVALLDRVVVDKIFVVRLDAVRIPAALLASIFSLIANFLAYFDIFLFQSFAHLRLAINNLFRAVDHDRIWLDSIICWN